MQALICERPGLFSYEEIEAPVAISGSAIIKIRRIGICGTDLHAYTGTQPYFEYPRILGHELSGELFSDDINGFEKGSFVTFIPYYNCGHCVACRNGLTNCCVSMKVCGVHVDGGMVEYLSVPISSLIHGGNRSLDELALIEPLAIGAHGIRRAGIKSGEFVLIVGAGPIGLGAMAFAKMAGATVIAMDTNEARLEFCKEHLGIANLVNPKTGDVIDQLRAITDGDMPTVVIDATGRLNAINNGFNYLAHGGRYVLIGLQKEALSFSHPEFHKREATLLSSRNATREDFKKVLSAMDSKSFNPRIFITHRCSFDDVKSQFESWLDPESGVVKAMVEL